MRFGSAWLLALAANVALVGQDARAEEPATRTQLPSAEDVAEARAAFWEAHEQYTAGNYRGAVALFERSYSLYPQNEVLFNIALAYAKSGDCDAAHQTLQQYSSANPEDNARDEARAKFESADTPCSFEPEPSVPVGSQPASPPIAPPPAPPPVAPPPPPRRPQEYRSPPVVDLADTTPSSYWTTPRIVGWSLAGAGAVASAAAIYFDERRRDAGDDARKVARDNPPDAGDRVRELEADYNRARTLTGATAVGAAAFTLAGVGLLLLGGDDEGSASLAIDRRGDFQLRLRGRF